MSQKYPQRSIPVLRAEIEKDKKRSYEGADGLGSYFSNILDLIQNKGVMIVPDLATLDTLTAIDAKIVAVKNYALYSYNPSAAALLPNSLHRPATGGGYWEYMVALGRDTHQETIGNSIDTEFTIRHGLNTTLPTIVQVQTLAGQPTTYGITAEVEIIDANSFKMTFDPAPASFQFTIGVKK